MKKEYKLVGKVTIPKKKRKEVKSIIQKILYLGGIREKETIEIDGRQCITAGIPKWNAREVMRYKGDKELMLSDNMQNSIERWKRAYGQVTEKEIKKLEMEKALKKLLEDFFYVWNFRVLDTAFVREFLKHKNDDRYKRAMIVLIELMDKETKYFPELTKREANIWLIREIRDADEMIEINAYLGMLRNHLRRKEILGF